MVEITVYFDRKSKVHEAYFRPHELEIETKDCDLKIHFDKKDRKTIERFYREVTAWYKFHEERFQRMEEKKRLQK